MLNLKVMNIQKTYLLLLTVFFLLTCQQDYNIGEPFNKKAQITGTWKIIKVTQVDINAETLGYKSGIKLDITHRIVGDHPYTDIEMSLKNDNTFTIKENKGYSPFPAASGKWALTDNTYLNLIVGKDTSKYLLATDSEFKVLDARATIIETTYEKQDKKTIPIVRYEFLIQKQI